MTYKPTNGMVLEAQKGLAWRGDAGFSFSRKIAGQLAEGDRNMQADAKHDTIESNVEGLTMIDEERAEAGGLNIGDFVVWNSSGGEAYGRVEEIATEG